MVCFGFFIAYQSSWVLFNNNGFNIIVEEK